MRNHKPAAHRRAAEVKLGRKLLPTEDVDHLDENHENNAPANLHVKPHGEHSSTTQSKERRSLRAVQRALAMTRKKEKLY